MAGTGFDQSEVYFTDPFGSEDTGADPNANVAEVKKQFRDFIREFHETNFVFPYRYVAISILFLFLLISLVIFKKVIFIVEIS